MARAEHDCPEHHAEIRNPRGLPFSPARSRGELAHIHKHGCTYFVTFCLHDQRFVRRRARKHEPADIDPITIALDSEPPRPAASPFLALHRVARLVEGALLHYCGVRYSLHSWCVMPDHVHALVTPFAGFPLDRVLHSWKSFTANEINSCLHRSGPLWERESFNHMVRSTEDFERFRVYIEANPVTAGLCLRPEDWPFSSARFHTIDG